MFVLTSIFQFSPTCSLKGFHLWTEKQLKIISFKIFLLKDNISVSIVDLFYQVNWFLEQEDNSKLEGPTIEEQLSSESWSFVTKT